MGITALGSMLVIVIVSKMTLKTENDPKGIELSKGYFKTDAVFNISAFTICLITAVLYALFW